VSSFLCIWFLLPKSDAPKRRAARESRFELTGGSTGCVQINWQLKHPAAGAAARFQLSL
jgi:hypothetical protein